MNTPTNPATATPAPTTVPEGMVRIEIARNGKTPKRVTVKKFPAGKSSDSAKNAFSTSDLDGVEMLEMFVNPVSGEYTVAYGHY